MAQVLVTGAAGTLGSALVPRLVARGHQVRVIAHQRPVGSAAGVEVVQGDVRRPEDVLRAADGMEVIIHAATSVFRAAKATELGGAQAVAAAAHAFGARLIYPSIVGVDAIAGTYYKAKLAAEQIVSAVPAWTIQRATQLHPTLDRTVGRFFPTTAHLAFQPVDAGEVADCLVRHVDAGPTGRAEDFGGPEIVALTDLVSIRRAVTGRRTTLVRLPAFGPLRGLDAGHQLSPDQARGQRTWEKWLQDSYR
jgi:uncharacterized protein YbjT (DUF2867 family)